MNFPFYTKTKDPDSVQRFVKHISARSCVRVSTDLNRIECTAYRHNETVEYEYFTRGESIECEESEYRNAFESVVEKLRAL